MILCSVLILCAKTATANTIAYALQRHGMEATTVQTVSEAFEKLKKKPADLIIVESKLNEGSGLAVLSEMRRRFPLAMRMIYETEPISGDIRTLINEVAPCSIFSGTVDAEKIWKIMALEGPVTHMPDVALDDQTLDPDRITSRNKDLEEQNALLLREIQKMKRLQKLWIRSSGERAAAAVIAKNENIIHEISIAMGKMLEDKEILLPVLPAIALQLQKVLGRENCTFDDIASMVGLEQGMSARILQVANSSVYAGLERIRNLQQAVARLGLRETQNILQVVIAENLFRTKNQVFANIMAKLWMHNLCCAYSNENIALTLEIPESDDFFMMGLLHDIGKLAILYMINHALEIGMWDAKLLTDDVVREVMVRCHNEIGQSLLEKWQYPQIFQQVVRHHNDASGVIGAQAEPVIVTYFSNLLTRKIGYSLVPWESNPMDDQEMAEALNMTEGVRLRLESNLEMMVEKIKQAFFTKK